MLQSVFVGFRRQRSSMFECNAPINCMPHLGHMGLVGDLSSSMCTMLHIWGISFEANPNAQAPLKYYIITAHSNMISSQRTQTLLYIITKYDDELHMHGY